MIVITYDNNNIDEKEKGEKVKREGKENISTKYDIVEKKEVAIPKPLTVWITMNCGKFWKRWEYHTTWPASWETYMEVRKQQLELNKEQQNGSK